MSTNKFKFIAISFGALTWFMSVAQAQPAPKEQANDITVLTTDEQQQLAKLARQAADIVAGDDEEARNDLIESLSKVVKENVARRKLRALQAEVDALRSQLLPESQAARGQPTPAERRSSSVLRRAPRAPTESVGSESVPESNAQPNPRSLLIESDSPLLDEGETLDAIPAAAEDDDAKAILLPQQYEEWSKNRTLINNDDLLFLMTDRTIIPDESSNSGLGLRIMGGSPTSGAPECCAIITPCQSICTGTLISPNVILTAAHCQCEHGARVQVFFGTSVQGATHRTAGRLVRHEQYRTNPTRNDLAVVILERPVPSAIKPRPIASTDEINNCRIFVAVGFGLTESGKTGRKFEVALPKISNNCSGGVVGQMRCNPRGEFVLGSPGKDTCGGDSGGPSYTAERLANGKFRIKLAGVTSRGPSACNGFGIYTRVDQYVEWLDGIIQQNQGSPRSLTDDELPATIVPNPSETTEPPVPELKPDVPPPSADRSTKPTTDKPVEKPKTDAAPTSPPAPVRPATKGAVKSE